MRVTAGGHPAGAAGLVGKSFFDLPSFAGVPHLHPDRKPHT